ncbi:hypothetical protein CGZ91_02785 [Parenemella sanctibonifatiensis]|uniref:Pyrrolo-quinoline quinone n=1 Tax=Parenemella sanctibonifatiensis TaxID=2016505 RepID=A0A255ELQ5_9ACTN|nr:hypothetical protein CGZ91_02785 [Parenemella sanctibonifatiensis]
MLGLGLMLALPTTIPASAATKEVELEVTDHGDIPLTATTVAGAATGMMPDGTPRTWAVISGKPAYLAEINPFTGEVLASHSLPGASGAWGVDIVTGEKTEIPLPEGRTDCTFTYEMATSGTDLFVHFQCASGNGGAIYDTVTGEWVTDFIPNMNPQRVGRDASGTTWFTAGGALHSISPDREITSTDLAVGTKGIGVVTEGDSEYVVSIYGNVLHRYDISTGDLEELVLDLPGTPTNPRSSVVGPDGRLHFGGYFSGGFATYDTTSDEWAFEAALGQAEGFATVGDTLYAGRYPGAKLEAIDTSKPLGDGNPVRALDLDPYGQDRPFALTDAGGLVAVGTVPEYGSLIGALAIHDPVTKQNDVYRNIIEDHSITALAYENGILYGGTSVYGGNGAFPTQQNARVFAFDMATRELVWNVEVEGQRMVTALEVTPGRQVWAGTKGTLHSLSTTDGSELVEYEIEPFDWDEFAGGTWTGAWLEFDRSTNRLYGAVGSTLISVPPIGRHDLTRVSNIKGVLMVLGDDHRVYFVNGQRLMSVDWRDVQ